MMQRLSLLFASIFIKHHDQVQHPDVRSQYGMLEGWVSAVVNLILAVAKLMLGLSLRSSGLISDAVHSLSDMLTSVVVIISFRISRKPPDSEHPFGHAKVEYVATLIVAILLIVAGVELGQENIFRLWGGDYSQESTPLTWGLFAVLVLLVAAKELLAAFSNVLARLIDSSTLAADAWHHRTDSISTGLVILGLWGRNFGIYWLDGITGALVSLFIIWAGVRLSLGSISPLLGEAVSAETLEKMKHLAAQIPHLVNVHDLLVHRYGHFYFTTIHVEISDSLDPHAMHEVTVLLEMRLLKAYPGQCVVHVDPLSLDHPMYDRVADTLRDAVVRHPMLVEFRDLNLWNRDGSEYGNVEISVQPSVAEKEFPKLSGELESIVHSDFPEVQFKVSMKVDFSATAMERSD